MVTIATGMSEAFHHQTCHWEITLDNVARHRDDTLCAPLQSHRLSLALALVS